MGVSCECGGVTGVVTGVTGVRCSSRCGRDTAAAVAVWGRGELWWGRVGRGGAGAGAHEDGGDDPPATTPGGSESEAGRGRAGHGVMGRLLCPTLALLLLLLALAAPSLTFYILIKVSPHTVSLIHRLQMDE